MSSAKGQSVSVRHQKEEGMEGGLTEDKLAKLGATALLNQWLVLDDLVQNELHIGPEMKPTPSGKIQVGLTMR